MPVRPTRRDVLKAAAITGAGLGAGFMPERLLEAMAAPACGTLADIRNVVIFIQENRSFDNYFGRYKGVRGFDDPSHVALFSQAYTAPPTGFSNPLQPFHLDTAFNIVPHQGQCTNDIEHQWAGAHLSWNGGANDHWMRSHITSEVDPKLAAVTMGYYDRSDLPFYYTLADNFTICDNYFCSVIGGTDQNRLVSMTGTLDPDGWDGGGGFFDTKIGTVSNPGANLGAGHKWKPYPEVLQAAGISWKVYGTPDGQLGDNVLRYFPQFRPAAGDVAVQGVDGPLALGAFSSNGFPADFALDCVTGNLPQVSWIVANLPDSEHAPDPIKWGESITHTVLLALTESGLWPNTLMFLTYDENGGFFDHVPPPKPPAKPANDTLGEYFDPAILGTDANIEGQKFSVDSRAEAIGLGTRVPTLVISPFSRNPTPNGLPLVSSDLFDHTSLLRFLETWSIGMQKPALIPNRTPGTKTPGLSAWRRGLVGDLTSSINFGGGRNASVPGFLTDPNQIPNRADIRVLTECIITGTIGSLDVHTKALVTPYPVPATNTMPHQEGPIGQKKTPSGPVAGQAACPPVTTPPATPAATPLPVAGSGNPLPNTATSGSAATTGEVLAGAAVVAAAWWTRRKLQNVAAEGSSGEPEEAET